MTSAKRLQPEYLEDAEQPEGATRIFVLGLLGIMACAGLGPFAWIQGNRYMVECRARRVKPDGMARAGHVLGIVGTCLGLLQVFGFIVFFVVARRMQ